MIAFKAQPMKFTLEDVGSEVIDQLSTDIYTNSGAIMRELVKNAYDSYLPFDDRDDVAVERRATVRREREKKVGKIFISDQGIGQTLQELKAMVQISVSLKPTEFDHATGFRGLGSWALLGAGSKITITSSKIGDPNVNRLEINVRKIYELIDPRVTLHAILNNPQCVKFSQSEDSAAKNEHYTSIEILCDGPSKLVRDKYEINRLYPFTDPNDTELRQILVRSCAIPFLAKHSDIRAIYDKVNYIPTALHLDGEPLERGLPETLAQVYLDSVNAADGRLLGHVWFTEDPEKSAEISDLDGTCNIDAPGLQLLKLNVPIGRKNVFVDTFESRLRTSRWYVGEIHIAVPDVLPDASGEGLRAGAAGEEFIERLEVFYKQLEDRGVNKSERVSARRKLQQAIAAAKKLDEEEHELSGAADLKERAKIGDAVAIIESSKLAKPTSEKDRKLRKIFADSEMKKLRDEAVKALKPGGYIAQYSKKQKPKASLKAAKTTKRKGQRAGARSNQLLFGRLSARLKEAALTAEQIEKVVAIVKELFAPDENGNS